MKLTEQHISEIVLQNLIEWANCPGYESVLKALLELKQRRYEDRQRECIKKD